MSSTSEFARSSDSRGDSASTKGRAEPAGETSPDSAPGDNTPTDETPARQTGAGPKRRRLEREILRISDREQRRIGVALHDGLGPHLTGISLLVRGLARDLRQGRTVDPEDVDEIARLLADGIEKTRTLAQELNPFRLAVRGLTVALADLASTIEAESGISCTFEEQGRGRREAETSAEIRAETRAETRTENDADDIPLTAEEGMHVYRIVQEAVANAVEHANASRIQITLSRRERGCRVDVVDDGIGYEPGRPTTEKPAGMGLEIMRYRAQLIGARLEVIGSPGGGKGTAVVCTFGVPA